MIDQTKYRMRLAYLIEPLKHPSVPLSLASVWNRDRGATLAIEFQHGHDLSVIGLPGFDCFVA